MADRKKRLDFKELAYLLNAEHYVMRSLGEVCFRKCIASFDKEHLSFEEENCVDRCTYKYHQVMQIGYSLVHGTFDYSSAVQSADSVVFHV